MTSSMLFYIGAAAAGAAVIGLCMGLAVIKIKTLSLKEKLDEEYGREDKKELT